MKKALELHDEWMKDAKYRAEYDSLPMTQLEKESVEWFCNPARVEPLPIRYNGTVNYEVLCGEFLVEGVPFQEVKFHFDRLPESLKFPGYVVPILYRKNQ